MEGITLPGGHVLVRGEAPAELELILDTRQDSLRWSCYLRVEFVAGECKVTIRPRERVVCAACGCDLDRVIPKPGQRLLCHSCRLQTLAALARKRTRRMGQLVRPPAWGQGSRRGTCSA